MSPRILVLYAHSNLPPSSVKRQLAAAAGALPHVVLHDLYRAYPDFSIDVKREQHLLEKAGLVVFRHPIQWYGMPALMKEWLDVVLETGWAYEEGSTALHGKDGWSVATTGGSADAYSPQGKHGYPFERFLPPFIQTARLCGMRWLKPLVLHGAREVEEATVIAHIDEFRNRLLHFPGWATQPHHP